MMEFLILMITTTPIWVYILGIAIYVLMMVGVETYVKYATAKWMRIEDRCNIERLY